MISNRRNSTLNFKKVLPIAYIMKQDAKQIFHNVNWKNYNHTSGGAYGNPKKNRMRLISKKTTTEQLISQINQGEQDCRYNLDSQHFVSKIIRVVKICKKSIKVSVYKLIGDTLWNQDIYNLPTRMRINKNADGELNYKSHKVGTTSN